MSALVAAIALALAACEVAVRLNGRFAPPDFPPECLRPELYEYHAACGYRLIPSRVTTYQYPQDNPQTILLRSNSDGFRNDREFDEVDERQRILVVGDSFVFGEGVQLSECFTGVLEAREPNWRIDNLGMTGFGPDLMLRALTAFGLKARPDWVVLCVYTDDLRRVRPDYGGVGFPIPRYCLQVGKLVDIPYPAPRPWDQLHLVQCARHVYWSRSRAAWDLNAAILDRFGALAEERVFRWAIIFLPGEFDTPADRQRRTWVAEYAQRQGVPFTDLTDAVHAAGREAFLPGNWHFSPKGHAIVAAELYRFLREEFASPGPQGEPQHRPVQR